MKKFFTIVGLSFAVLLIVAIIGFGMLAYQGQGLDEESKEYVNKVAPIILTDLNRHTLFKYADDHLINSATPEEFDEVFSIFKKLGKFQVYHGCSGQANINFNAAGKTITAYYEAKASFDNGDATVKITTIKRAKQWKIIGFHIDSPIFLH